MACKIEPVGGELLKPWPFIIDDADNTFITPIHCDQGEKNCCKSTQEWKRLSEAAKGFGTRKGRGRDACFSFDAESCHSRNR